MAFPPLRFLASCESVCVNGHDFVAHEMSHPFLVELRMPMSNTPRGGVRNYDFPFPCRLARQASAGPAGYAVKRRGQPARRITVLSNADLLPALSRAMRPATKETVCRLAAALSTLNRNARCKSALHLVVHEHDFEVPAGGIAPDVRRFNVEPVAAVAVPARVPASRQPEAKTAA